ncbi:hypothetical protein CEXT_175571 [Caerostris extrusa]|uniref:Uncharacterized protein n=1 Tax=Caerostris extrusa TaxID=172846 RepID=A0AAV4TZ63_CAEEX|nr:hypothetical protein CEXT_175571 [Caerostris extrusa]
MSLQSEYCGTKYPSGHIPERNTRVDPAGVNESSDLGGSVLLAGYSLPILSWNPFIQISLQRRESQFACERFFLADCPKEKSFSWPGFIRVFLSEPLISLEY